MRPGKNKDKDKGKGKGKGKLNGNDKFGSDQRCEARIGNVYMQSLSQDQGPSRGHGLTFDFSISPQVNLISGDCFLLHNIKGLFFNTPKVGE